MVDFSDDEAVANHNMVPDRAAEPNFRLVSQSACHAVKLACFQDSGWTEYFRCVQV